MLETNGIVSLAVKPVIGGLHYFVADAFAEVIVAPRVHGDTVEWHIVSDRLLPVSGVVEAAVYTFDGSERPTKSNGSRVGRFLSKRPR